MRSVAVLKSRSIPVSIVIVAMIVTIVVTVVPIMVPMPAALVLIPPAMMLAPAAFPRLVQFVPFVVGLPAIASVVLNCFVQLVFCMRNAALALFFTLRMHARHG